MPEEHLRRPLAMMQASPFALLRVLTSTSVWRNRCSFTLFE